MNNSKLTLLLVIIFTLMGCLIETEEAIEESNSSSEKDSTLNDSTVLIDTSSIPLECDQPVDSVGSEDTLWTPYDDTTLILDSALLEYSSAKENQSYLIQVQKGGCYGYCPPTSARVYEDGLVIYERGGDEIDAFTGAFYISDSALERVKVINAELEEFHKVKSQATDSLQVYCMVADIGEHTLQNGEGISYSFNFACYEYNGLEEIKNLYDEVNGLLDLQRFPVQGSLAMFDEGISLCQEAERRNGFKF